MIEEFKIPNGNVVIDPNSRFPNASPAALMSACGFLLPWATEYFANGASPTLKAHMTKSYGFGDLFPMKITLHPDGHLSYPNDPDLHPFLMIIQSEPTAPPLQCYIYQYGIVAMVENGERFITRMD